MYLLHEMHIFTFQNRNYNNFVYSPTKCHVKNTCLWQECQKWQLRLWLLFGWKSEMEREREKQKTLQVNLAFRWRNSAFRYVIKLNSKFDMHCCHQIYVNCLFLVNVIHCTTELTFQSTFFVSPFIYQNKYFSIRNHDNQITKADKRQRNQRTVVVTCECHHNIRLPPSKSLIRWRKVVRAKK